MGRRTHRHRDIDTPGNASAESHGFESPNCHNTFDIRPDTLTMMVSHNNF